MHLTLNVPRPVIVEINNKIKGSDVITLWDKYLSSLFGSVGSFCHSDYVGVLNDNKSKFFSFFYYVFIVVTLPHAAVVNNCIGNCKNVLCILFSARFCKK